MDTTLNTMGSCWNKHTLGADKKLAPEDLQWAAGKYFSGFSVWEVSPTQDNWEILCFLPSKTANSWELTVSDGCTVRSCKPAWSCQKIKYLETHMGLNQTERQPCKRTSEKKKWKLLLIHWMSIFPMAAWLRNVSVTKLYSWKSYCVIIIGFLRGKNLFFLKGKTFTAY